MKLPPEVRKEFQKHGRAGGFGRAARLSARDRSAIARKAATARWIRHHFGASTFAALGLPGGELVDSGLADLAHNRTTLQSLLVSLAAQRLRREKVPVGSVEANPEERLYGLLTETEGDLAHARYNAWRRQIVSFADACRLYRREPDRRAS